jgi:exopolyphosphatase/guanosine-5'-triphosphate,3'-diphosphate pyrophosphatase
MRRAVVDIGSNSTRLLVAELEDGQVTAELVRRTKVTRLGQGVDADGRLHPEAMDRVYATLDEYRALIDECGAEEAVAVLTSAVRDAANGEEFADTVRTRYRIEPHVLAGEQEAQLTFLGATSERDPDDDTPTLVIDIGGGSTEMIVGAHHRAGFHVSAQAGVVRMSERHIHSDPPTSAELDEVAGDVRAIIQAAVPDEQRRAVAHGIGVAGTATSLAAIAQRLDPYDPEKVHGYVLDGAERDRLRDYLASLPLDERREVPGLDPDRAPTIVPGVVILEEVMAMFGLREIEISEHDILRGAALGL